MQIKALEVAGFKSFVDRVKLNFKPGITALVGPNGCGKSNIIDAIRWIMGEHNARHLRGAKMDDLIFNGSASRKPIGMAEVSMILANSNGNGNGGSVTISPTETMITRRIFRSGDSEYLINKVPCRLKDIIEVFLDSGVGTKSYSIMEQGKVDFILSLKPDERRILIEEAAGISKFRVRKKEALSKMDSTRNNLQRLNDVLNELQVQMHGLGIQVKRLKRHKNIKEEMKNIDLVMASSRIKFLTISRTNYLEQISKYKDDEMHISSQISSTEARLEKDRLRLTEIHNTIEQLNQNNFKAKETIQREESSISLSEHEIKNTFELLDKSRSTLKELESDTANLDNEICTNENELKTINSEIKNIQDKVSSSSENLTASKSRLIEVQGKIEHYKSALLKSAHEITEIKNAETMNKRLQDEINFKLQKIVREKEISTSTIFDLTERKSLLEKEINDCSDQRQQKELKIQELKKIISDLSITFQEKDASLNEVKDTVGRVSARLESMMELQKSLEGFDRGVKTIINRDNGDFTDLNGIVGLFADAIETDPEYEHVVEAALEKKLQSVIVETHQDSFNAIEQLKHSSSGRVSFIPLTLGEETSTQPDLQTAVPLISIVRTSNGFQNIIRSVLSDMILVDNMSHALEIWTHNRSKYTIVTKDAEIIDPKGIITGGIANGSSSGILKRNREIKEFKDQLIRHESRLQILKDEKEKIALQLNNSKQAFETHSEEKQLIENRLFQLKTNFDQAVKELQNEKDKADLLSFDESKCIASLNEQKSELEQLQSDETLKHEAEDVIRLALDKQLQDEHELKDELQNSENIYTDFRVSLASKLEKQASTIANLNRLVDSKKLYQSKISALDYEIDNMANKTSVLATAIEKSKEQRGLHVKESMELEKQIDCERSISNSIEDSVRTAEQSLKQLRVLREDIEPKIHEIDIKLSESAIHQANHEKNIMDKYGILPENFPPVPDSYNEDEHTERLGLLQKRLENIGEVNLGASSEYEDIEKRFNFLKSQQDDLLNSIYYIQKVIAKINSITKKKFFDVFNQINNHFQELFPLLFNGGKAYMQLTDESDLLETGIEIFAQPAGKKLQSLDLLSGGERALTVIALMFAIFLTRPSPFCLMDEIDAPLDDTNIGRFITHLQKMAERSQFIIVTHNKLSMQAANSLYGITMEERGVSKIVSVELN